jgi:hypothetical protein
MAESESQAVKNWARMSVSLMGETGCGDRRMSVPKNIFLLRNNGAGKDSLVLRDTDLPIRFIYSGKNYVVDRTKSGKMIMKAE